MTAPAQAGSERRLRLLARLLAMAALRLHLALVLETAGCKLASKAAAAESLQARPGREALKSMKAKPLQWRLVLAPAVAALRLRLHEAAK